LPLFAGSRFLLKEEEVARDGVQGRFLSFAMQVVGRNAGVADLPADCPCPLLIFGNFGGWAAYCQMSEVITK
jgi:hypothetical protein